MTASSSAARAGRAACRAARRSLASLLAGAVSVSACAAPDAVEIRVELAERGVPRYRLQVLRGDNEATVVDCTLDAIGARAGTCPFEDAEGRFAPEEGLRFVAYGRATRRIQVRVEALDEAGRVVSSTAAAARVGEQPLISLRLPARSEPRRRCSLPLASLEVPEGLRDDTAVTRADVDGDGVDELVATFPGGLVVARYRASADGCAIEPLARVETDCVSRAAGVVAGALDAAPGLELALVCAERGGGPASLVAWSFARPERPVRLARHVLPVAGALVSRPVLADQDGDGVDEVMVVSSSTTSNQANLAVWAPSAARFTLRPLRNVAIAVQPGAGASHAPIVTRLQGRDVVYVAGYRGGAAIAGGSGAPIVVRHAIGPALLSPVVVAGDATADIRVVWMRDDDGRTVAQLLAGDLVPVEPRVLPGSGPRFQGVNLVAPALGPLDGTPGLELVVARDGEVAIVSGVGEPRRFSIGAGISGVMTVLLASVDGRPGADVIAYSPTGGRVFAADATGAPIAGWPIDAGIPGVPSRVLVGDLDQDGAAELVVASFLALEVVGFGPTTWRDQDSPWPLPFHDARGTGGIR
jgi:hypothetical protein